jgi:hypothetical protein
MSKIRRGGYVFPRLEGRSFAPPRYKDSEFVVKWDLDNWLPMKGRAPARVLRLNRRLEEEGLL